MRAGAEYFPEPSEPAQRRYEALRAYFVDGLRGRRGRRAVRLLAGERASDGLEICGRGGPRSSATASRARRAAQGGPVRDEVLALRAQDRSIEEIAAALTLAGNAGVRADGLDDPCRRRASSACRAARRPHAGRPPRLARDQGARA